MLGTGALLYYLPNGTRVTQEASEQVGPRHLVSAAVSPCPRGAPTMGLAPEPRSLLQEHCCYQGTVQGIPGSWASLCACAGLR